MAQGLAAKLIPQDDDEYDVIVSLRSKPDVEVITERESEFGKLARGIHGHPDGWGFENDDNVIAQ
jgi:hypothetical protein